MNPSYQSDFEYLSSTLIDYMKRIGKSIYVYRDQKIILENDTLVFPANSTSESRYNLLKEIFIAETLRVVV